MYGNVPIGGYTPRDQGFLVDRGDLRGPVQVGVNDLGKRLPGW